MCFCVVQPLCFYSLHFIFTVWTLTLEALSDLCVLHMHVYCKLVSLYH